MCSSVALLLVSGVLLAQAAQLPLSFPRCRRRDPNLNKCLVSAIQTVMPQLAPGIPELGFPPLDPFSAGVLDLPRAEGSRFSLGLRLSDTVMHGFSRLQVIAVKANLDNSRLDVFAQVNLRIEANYEMDAVIMGEPLLSQGRCNLTFIEAQGFISPTGVTLERGGARYLHVDQGMLTVTAVPNATFNFDRLDHDPERNAALNNLLNDHSQEVFQLLTPAWEQQWSRILGGLSNHIFDNVPLDQIFPEDRQACLSLLKESSRNPTVLFGPDSNTYFLVEVLSYPWTSGIA